MSCDSQGSGPASDETGHARAAAGRLDEASRPPTLASVAARAPSPPLLADDCLILAGPTAAGKTAIALPLAKRLGAEIVSVDSMAVYRTLDIGTAKPSAAEQQQIPHHAIDLVEPSEPFSVAAWLSEAGRAVDRIRARGRRVLFVGGTPLYLKALREGLAAGPAADPALRESLAVRLEREGAAALHRELATLDPGAAARIHPNDWRRTLRGIEVATVAPASHGREATWERGGTHASTAPMLIVDVPRKLLNERIAARVQKMFSAGLVEEVRAAEANGGIGATAGQAAGYSEVLAMLAGRSTLSDAIEQTIRRTRQLAKRQRTWLRSFGDAVWICG